MSVVNNIDWSKILDVFPILQSDKANELKEEKHCTESEYNEAVEMIIGSNMADDIERLIFSRIEKIMRQQVIPRFWSHFSVADDGGGKMNAMNDFRQFHNAVEELYRDLSVHIPLISKLEKLRRRDVKMYGGELNIFNAFKLLLRSTLLSQLPPSNHNGCIENFYEIAFRAFCHLDDETDDDDDAECCGGCLSHNDCQCQTICNLFFETNRRLVELDLLEPLVGQVLTSLIQIRIENHITQICNNSYDTSYIELLEKWLNSVVMSWLNQIYCVDDSNIQLVNPKISESMIQFERKLKHLLFETITKTRINQLFTIIIEYPDSLAAVEDLNKTLPNTDLRPLLINQLKMALENRLLHAGVSTPDILTAYIAAIRSLRVLDPTGVLVNTISVPIHKYLRSREDTVRCVVGSLTEEGPNCDLADELARGQSSLNESREDWEQWLPDPIDVVDPSKSSNKNQTSSDIISMLVNVYGSKELFVNEYRNLLADRLLSQSQCSNTDKEIRYLELLKLRFGESQLHFCEVMLKDICDSKRINTHLQNDQQYKTDSEHFPLSALIISAQFWPVFKEETLQLPSIIVEQFQYFTKAFEALKGNRTLCWKPHLGSVQLEIELKDRVLNLTVSPLQASIIMSFQQKPQWSIDELSQELKVPATLLRKKINFWQSQAILREIANDVFLLIEENSTAKSSHSLTADIIICEDDEAESAMASSQDQREEELQVFWSYIIGMLTNLDSMPLERIHQMLKMFASQGPTAIECSLQELRHFLDRKVREHKLIFTAGYYRLPKI